MAIIGKIRKQSGFLIIIVGIALAAFVLGDFLNPRNSRRKNINIIEVFGEEIPVTQFNAKVEENIENQKRNQEKSSLKEAEIFSIKEQTYKQIVDELILSKEYEALNISVTPDELFDLVQGNEPHQYILQYFKDPNTQQYDPQLVRNYLSQLDQMPQENRAQWLKFEKAIKEDRIKTKYRNLLSKGYSIPDTFLYKDYVEKRYSLNIRLVGYRYSSIPDTAVTVSKSELNDYYEKYKMNYKQDASSDINYVVFEVNPSQEDLDRIRIETEGIFSDFRTAENVPVFVNANSDSRFDSSFVSRGKLSAKIDTVVFNSEPGTFVAPFMENSTWYMAKLLDVQMRPDSMKASHILFSFQGANGAGEEIKRTKEQARKTADSLFSVIKSDPASMEALAKRLSDDPSAKNNSGDLGWFADGAMVPEFNKAVMDGKTGDITRCESVFGFHIIKITGKKEPSKKVKVAVISRKITPSNKTYQEIFANASKFQGESNSIETFDQNAKNMGISVRNATYLLPMGTRIAGFEHPRQLVQWAHLDHVKVGSVSPVMTIEEKFVVAIVTKKREKGIPPIEEMMPVIEPLAKKDKKGEIAVQKIKDAIAQTSDLYGVASRLGSRVDTVKDVNFNNRNIANFGNEGKLVARALEFNTMGVISEPVKGESAAFVYIIDQIIPPDPKGDYRVYKKVRVNEFGSKVNNFQFLPPLTEKAEVVDNRVLFY